MKLVLPEDFHNEVLELIVSETLVELSNEATYFVQYLRDSTNRKEITLFHRGKTR